jgi:hypothetical protein
MTHPEALTCADDAELTKSQTLMLLGGSELCAITGNR